MSDIKNETLNSKNYETISV